MILKIVFALSFCLISTTNECFAQPNSFVYPPSEEAWSKPKIFTPVSDSFGVVYSSYVRADGKQLFFQTGSKLYMVEKTDTGWTKPKKLNNYINSGLIREHAISPDGKLLFYIRFSNGWFLFCNYWDENTNDWGPSIKSNINNFASAIGEPFFINDTTLIVGSSGSSRITTYDSIRKVWRELRYFPQRASTFPTSNGFTLMPDLKNYMGNLRNTKSISGYFDVDDDISVTDFDSANQFYNYPPNTLSFCLDSDSLYFEHLYGGREEGYPIITADGRTIYFTANYVDKWKPNIYVSYRTQDDVVHINELKDSKIDEYALHIYPNPFNSNVKITFKITETENVKISLYDVLGNEISTIFNGIIKSGIHELYFPQNQSISNLSSGIYFCRLESGQFISVKKLMLLK